MDGWTEDGWVCGFMDRWVVDGMSGWVKELIANGKDNCRSHLS